MTDQEAAEKYREITLKYFSEFGEQTLDPEQLTSIEVRGYERGIAHERAKLAKVKEALEFYANENNWMVTREDNLHTAKMTIIGDTRSYGVADQPRLASKLLVIGGAKAEEALAKAEEILKEVVK